MKHLLLILFLSPLLGQSQITLPTKEGKIHYEFIDSTLTASKEALYSRSKAWFSSAFKDAKNVIQNDDKDAGLVTGKGVLRFLSGSGLLGQTSNTVRFTVDITSKDNKYRIRIYDIMHIADTDYPVEPQYERYQQGKDKKYNDVFFTALNTKILEIVQGVKKKMAENATDF